MIQPATWTKTLLDALIDSDWHDVEGRRVRTYVSYLETWMLKIEQHGRYPGYGFRVYWRSGRGGLLSRFMPDEAAVIRWLTREEQL